MARLYLLRIARKVHGAAPLLRLRQYVDDLKIAAIADKETAVRVSAVGIKLALNGLSQLDLIISEKTRVMSSHPSCADKLQHSLESKG